MSAIRRLVVIDPTLNNLAALMQAFISNPLVDVLLLNPAQDGLTQVANQVATGLYAALDVFSPGLVGAMTLNGVTISSASLSSQASTWAQIGSALQGGPILLYGSQIAAGTTGQSFINALADLTGVVVSASTGLSGTTVGTDWVLEATSHAAPIDVASLIPMQYVGLLDVNAAPVAQIQAGDWGHPVTRAISIAGHTEQVALLDINGDGHLDLVSVATSSSNLANWQHFVSIATGKGDGTFNAPVNAVLPNQLTQAQVADTNGDGRADVVATGWSDWNQPTLSILHGNAQGGLDAATSVPVNIIADSLLVRDLNGDGRPEVILGGTDMTTQAYGLSILQADAVGGFGAIRSVPLSQFHTTSIQVGDVNGDGAADIVVVGDDQATGQVSTKILTRNGSGIYQVAATVVIPEATHFSGQTALADVTGDGRADLLLTGMDSTTGASTLTVLAANTAGAFDAAVITTIAGSFWPGTLSTGDLNGDGRSDVVVSGFDAKAGAAATLVLMANPNSTLNSTPNNPWTITENLQTAQRDGITGLALGDVNHDGQLDMVIAGNSLSSTGWTQQLSLQSSAPVAGNEDTVQTLTLSGTDSNGTIDHFNLRTLPVHGMVYLDAALTKAVTLSTNIVASQNSATLYFKPDANWNGDTSLAFVAVDNQNTVSLNPATLPITVTAVNDAPTALSSLTGSPNSFFTVQQFLGYQTNNLQTLSNYAASHTANYTVQTGVIDFSDTGSGGVLGGSNLWPAAVLQNYVGTGGVNDNFFARVTATFSVSAADTYTFRNITDDGSFLRIDDTVVINDPTYHGQAPFSGSITLTPGNHTLELYFFENGGGAILELSAKSSTGTYQLMGSSGGIFSPATASIAEDSALSLILQGSDVDGTVASFKLSSLPSHGTAYRDAALTQALTQDSVISASHNNATLYFKPGPNWNGNTQLAFVAIDNQGTASANAVTLPITVTAVNDAPVVAAVLPAFADQAQNRAFSIALPAGLFADLDSPALTYSAQQASGAALPAWLSCDATTGTLSGTPTGLSSDLTLSLIISASDGQYSVAAPAASLKILAGLINLTAGADVYVGTSADEQINGLAGNDSIKAGAGNDTLNGGTGNDTMFGGPGDDIYVVDVAADVVTELLNEGTDLVQSSVTYTLPTNVEKLTLIGTLAINGTGNGLTNVLMGNSAANSLNGGAGADTLIGGLGDDSYTVDNVGDVVVEALGEGTDSVSSSISYSLAGTQLERLTLTGTTAISATGNDFANGLSGNAAANVLDGGLGNDTLNGGVGADTLIGGLGDDSYSVDDAGDVVLENVGEGTDSVSSSISYSLAGTQLERLTLTGTTAISATGNDFANGLTGNAAANVLDGGLGNDTLNGGVGADTLIGGLGDDSYSVDDAGDVVLENAGEGTDSVSSSISYSLAGTQLERLTLTGTTAISATGNDFANGLSGNAAANVLDGGLGNDTLNGGVGADTLIGGLGNDALTGGADADQFVFNTATATTNIDTITDFVAGMDSIVLDTSVFAGTGQHNTTLSASMLRAGAGYTTAAAATDHLIFNTSTGKLYYDADGVGGLAAVQIATLTRVSSLTAHDIYMM